MEPILHFVLPLTALMLLGLDLKTAAPLALLGILPDFDSLLLIHRSFSHSIVVTGLIFVTIYLVITRYKPAYQNVVILGFLVVASHLVLDLGGLTPILWPIYPNDVSVKFSLNIILGNGFGIAPSLQVAQVPTDFTRMPGLDYPLFTEEGFLLAVVLLAPILYKLIQRSHK